MPTKEELVREYFKFTNKDEIRSVDPDVVLFTLRKFVRLALANNPSVLELMFVRPNHIIEITEEGKQLMGLGPKFLSKRIYNTYGGYAISQLKRIENKGFNRSAGQARKEEFAHCGYNAKHAMHCIRLLRVGIEALTTGTIEVFRHDKKELIAIRNGEWPIQKVLDKVEKLRELLEEAFVRSTLPMISDFETIQGWVESLYEQERKETKDTFSDTLASSFTGT